MSLASHHHVKGISLGYFPLFLSRGWITEHDPFSPVPVPIFAFGGQGVPEFPALTLSCFSFIHKFHFKK